MGEMIINAKVRAGKTGSYKHRLRNQGMIPAVIYGQGVSSEPIELDAKELDSVLHKKGRNALIDLVLNGKQGENKYVVMIKEIQRDPLRRDIVHADLCKISLKDKIHTTIPVVITGETEVQKKGGILQHGLREVDIECMASNIPENIRIDVANLDIGGHISIADVPVNANYRILSDPAALLVSIAPMRATAQEEEKQQDSEDNPEDR